jgi:hypothetical protein
MSFTRTVKGFNGLTIEVNIMKQNVNFYAFRDAFYRMDRQSNFPGNGLSVLFDYLEAFEDDIGEEIELDVVGLCCDYSQDHWIDVACNYKIDLDEESDDADKMQAVIDYLQDNTAFVGVANDEELIYEGF